MSLVSNRRRCTSRMTATKYSYAQYQMVNVFDILRQIISYLAQSRTLMLAVLSSTIVHMTTFYDTISSVLTSYTTQHLPQHAFDMIPIAIHHPTHNNRNTTRKHNMFLPPVPRVIHPRQQRSHRPRRHELRNLKSPRLVLEQDAPSTRQTSRQNTQS